MFARVGSGKYVCERKGQKGEACIYFTTTPPSGRHRPALCRRRKPALAALRGQKGSAKRVKAVGALRAGTSSRGASSRGASLWALPPPARPSRRACANPSRRGHLPHGAQQQEPPALAAPHNGQRTGARREAIHRDELDVEWIALAHERKVLLERALVVLYHGEEVRRQPRMAPPFARPAAACDEIGSRLVARAFVVRHATSSVAERRTFRHLYWPIARSSLGSFSSSAHPPAIWSGSRRWSTPETRKGAALDVLVADSRSCCAPMRSSRTQRRIAETCENEQTLASGSANGPLWAKNSQPSLKSNMTRTWS